MSVTPTISIPPTAIVILGGTGNLAETKLLPALFDLYMRGALPSFFMIVGVSRKAWGDVDYQRYVTEAVSLARPHASTRSVTAFASLARFRRGDFDDALTYAALGEALSEIDHLLGMCTNTLFYLAVPPLFYSTIFAELSASGLMDRCKGTTWSRLLVEKPFGRDLETAIALEAQLREQFSDEQVYRIDHYLAKDAIENILALRFGNQVLADSWRKGGVATLSIRLLEHKDVSTRGSFYDGIGALRDVGQNHLLQMLALLTMPPTDVRDVEAMRAARAEIIEALAPPTHFVRGQYDGYRDTEGVSPDSATETYFKLTTSLSTPEWSGVPITLEAGKALGEARADAVVRFAGGQQCHCGVEGTAHTHDNELTITIAPEQRITLRLWVKRPGFDYVLEPRDLELVHQSATDRSSPEAYERVLYDCILGDQTRFVSAREVTAAWRFITPLLATATPPLVYTPGSSGPKAA